MSLVSMVAVAVLAMDRPAQSPEPPGHQHDVVGACAHAQSEFHDAATIPHLPAYLTATSTDFLDQTDVLHYNLSLEIVPGSNTLIGTNIITIKALANGVTTFPLQLHQNFTIAALQVNGVNVTSNRLDVANLTVNLNQTFNTNDQFEIMVSYSGVPVSGGFGSINFTTQSGNPLIFTLSEPFYAHTWWPVKEDNRDKATGDLAFIVPNTLQVASNGLRQGIDVVAGNKLRYRWKTIYQTTPYLFCFSASVYTEFTDLWKHALAPPGGMLMQFFIYPASDTPTNRNAWLATKQMLSTFTDLYGVYPFADEKYGIYQFGFGGGMEHQTMTGQGTFSNSTTAHEAAHQWWGDMVTCETFNHIWLNEGFATYSEALWIEFQPGSTGTPALLTAMSNRRPTTMDVIAYRYDISSASLIFSTNAVYRKGAWVLHMLRHIVGDDNFFEIVNTYGDVYEHSTATTEDLQAVAEGVWGESLEWFFDPWIYYTGAPSYQTAWRNVSAAGTNYVELYIRQVQNAAWQTFSMPIDIRTTANAVNSITTVWNDERTEHLLFPAPNNTPITALAVDPDNYILHPTNQTTTFAEGPPKVVSVSPAPGTQAQPGTVNSVQIVFHRTVSASAGHFSITGANTGSVPFIFSYDGPSMTATLTPAGALDSDMYTVTVSASLTGAVGGLALDGELIDPMSAASLPSGDGMPGGALVFAFEVVPVGCAEDLTGDLVVGVNDLLALINQWGPCGSPCPADITPLGGDGMVGVSDLLALINAWGPCN